MMHCKWMAKNTNPEKSGWYHIKYFLANDNGHREHVTVGYFDDSDSSWLATGTRKEPMRPNNSFSEWLLITGLKNPPTINSRKQKERAK